MNLYDLENSKNSRKPGISKKKETEFHAKLDTLVHNTFGKRKGELEEANPHNFDSDEDYYAAKNAPAKPRYRGTSSPGVNQDDEAYFREIFRKKREAAKKAEQDKGQVNELDKKTLGSYVKKATNSMDTHAYHAYRHQDDSDYDKKEKRKQGINKAVDRLTKGQDVAEGTSKDAWAAGYQAFHDDVTKCPYAPGSKEAGQWNLGWESAQARGWDKEGVAEGQLNEYLVRAGMPVKDVLALNLFQDTGPDGQEGMADDPRWGRLMKKYQPIANMLAKKIMALGKNRRLSDAEADAIEQTWYDGSDAYDDMEIEYLADYYDQQIDIIEALLAGNITDEEFGMAEGEEMGTFAALKDWRVWDVRVFNNFYAGKYADYGPRLYSVVASSPEEARQVVINNPDYVLQDLLARKLQNGKRVLPRGSALPVEEKRVGKADPGTITTMGFKKMLTPDGVQSFKFTNGKIVDGAHVKGGEEQGVAEGLNDTVKQKAKEFGKYMTEPDTPQQAVVRDRAKNIAKIRKNKEQDVAEGSLEEDKGMTGYNAFKREWRAKHGADAKVPAYDSKEYTSYVYRQNDKKQGVAEGDVVAFPKKHKGDLTSIDDCPKCGGDLQGGKYQGHEVKVCMPCKQVYLPPNSGIDQKGNKIEEGPQLSELSNELLDRYKKELGVRASAADKAGNYDKGHELFKKINKATIRQGDNDARRHEQQKQDEMMETRLDMMRKAGYDL